MPPISDSDRMFDMLEKILDKVSRLESRTAVIEDQNRGYFRELEYLKGHFSHLGARCDEKHRELEDNRHEKERRVGERLQRLETIIWLLGSTVSVLALILGGGVLVRIIGG